MAYISKCPNPECKSSIGFESVNSKVENYNYKLNMIQCRACGTVVGVTEHLNIGATILELAKKLGVPF